MTRLATDSFKALFEPGDQEVQPDPVVRQAIVDQFHKLYHASGDTTWKNTRYRGVRVLKIPFDLRVPDRSRAGEALAHVEPQGVPAAGPRCKLTARLQQRFDLIHHSVEVVVDHLHVEGCAEGFLRVRFGQTPFQLVGIGIRVALEEPPALDLT